MSGSARRRTWLIVVVLAHLVVAIVHGAAHAQARVPLSPEANLFVFIVILAGPLIGLALTWVAGRTGAWTVAVTFGGGSGVRARESLRLRESRSHHAHRPGVADALHGNSRAARGDRSARVRPGDPFGSRKETAMNVFIAGGSGTIGIPLVRALVAAGHQVTALTRSPGKQAELRALGARPAVADALDRDALITEAAHPTHVIHQLTALPKDGPRRASDLNATNRLRIDGTRNLLDAAVNAGTRRFIVGSFAILSARSPVAATSTSEADEPDEAAAAVRSMENQVLDATRRRAIEGVVLRYGLFYGPETPSTVRMVEMIRKRRLPVVRGDGGQLPCIHVDDAVSATVAALDRAPAGGTYDIVDDHAVSMTEIVQTIADTRARRHRSASPRGCRDW